VVNKKVFVTGGAGFIGSHLVDRLTLAGNTVTVYDNLSSGRIDWLRHHLGRNGFQFVKADLLDLQTLKCSIKGHDVVWHLGANTDIRRGNEATDLDLNNNVIATQNVLEAMRENKIGQILFTSSATAYGDAPPVPLSEDFGPLLPISLYGSSKLACEGMISAYCHLFGFRAWIFRFANVVGANMGHGVIHDFIQKLRQNPEELEILGDGKQEKPFFLVEDCIDGMLCAYQNSEKQYDIYNLGCETSTLVDTVAQIVAGKMGLKNVTVRYGGGRRGWPGDVPVLHYNVDKMKSLGWSARHTSDEAVAIAAERLVAQLNPVGVQAMPEASFENKVKAP